MAGNSPVAITDLPPELIELFLPDPTPSTIKTLKSVNRYFNTVFSGEKFCQYYLCYEQRYYLCDINSESRPQNVQEIIQEITEGKVSKWAGYLKLQKIHMKNWSCKQISSPFDVILLSSAVIHNVVEMIDNNHEHWICFSVKEYLHMWNITSTPRALEPFYVGPHTSVELLPQGLVAVKLGNSQVSLVCIYQFKWPEYVLKVIYRFHVSSSNTVPWSPSSAGFLFFENYFISYGMSIPPYINEWSLKVMDLDSVAEVKTVNLACTSVFWVFVIYLKYIKVIDIVTDLSEIGNFSLALYPGEFPNIIVVFSLRRNQRRLYQVNIFNVKTLKFCYIHQSEWISSTVTFCCMFKDKICVKEDVYHLEVGKITTRLLIFKLCRNPFQYPSPFLPPSLIELPLPANIIKVINLRPMAETVMYKKPNVLVESFNSQATTSILIVNLNSDPIEQQTCFVGPNQALLGYLAPNILLLYDILYCVKIRRIPGLVPTSSCSYVTALRVYNTLIGKEAFSWYRVKITPSFLTYFNNLIYPSKIILSMEGFQHLKVIYF